MRAAEAGFSLLEVLLAAGVFVVAALGALGALRELGAAAQHVHDRHAAYAALQALGERWRSEARSASAVWSSAPVLGTGGDACVQLDFYTADAAGPKFWSYRSFPRHAASDPIPSDALERLSGTAPLAPCDPSLAGTLVLSGLQATPQFTAVAPQQLGAHLDPYLQQPDSPFVAAGVPATAPVPLGVLDASAQSLTGGNTLLEARLDTAAGSSVVDLLPGVVPSGFTEVLHYTCSERCDVGHDSAAAKTLTACTASWQTVWVVPVAGGWFVGGTFTFAYSGTRASDGGQDALATVAAASNWDPARNYTAFPPGGPAPDGSDAGTRITQLPGANAAAWYAAFAPYLPTAQRATIGADLGRCTSVENDGENGLFYVNG